MKKLMMLVLVLMLLVNFAGCNAQKTQTPPTPVSSEEQEPVSQEQKVMRVWDRNHPEDREKDPYFSVSIESMDDAIIECREDVDAKIYVNDEYLLGGMGDYCTSIYLTDITGDGKYELCFGMSSGSGIVDDNIVVYDYETRTCIFSLHDRMVHDYYLFVRDDTLCVKEAEYKNPESTRTGVLVYTDGEISVSWDEENAKTE